MMRKVHSYLSKTSLTDISHNGAFQQAQPSGSFGATSTRSFRERQLAERNRRIASYRHSKLVLDRYSNREIYDKNVSPTLSADSKSNHQTDKSVADDVNRFKNIRQSGAINQAQPVEQRPRGDFYGGIQPEIGR